MTTLCIHTIKLLKHSPAILPRPGRVQWTCVLSARSRAGRVLSVFCPKLDRVRFRLRTRVKIRYILALCQRLAIVANMSIITYKLINCEYVAKEIQQPENSCMKKGFARNVEILIGSFFRNLKLLTTHSSGVLLFQPCDTHRSIDDKLLSTSKQL